MDRTQFQFTEMPEQCIGTKLQSRTKVRYLHNVGDRGDIGGDHLQLRVLRDIRNGIGAECRIQRDGHHRTERHCIIGEQPFAAVQRAQSDSRRRRETQNVPNGHCNGFNPLTHHSIIDIFEPLSSSTGDTE